jgi:hypothetical protein
MGAYESVTLTLLAFETGQAVDDLEVTTCESEAACIPEAAASASRGATS